MIFRWLICSSALAFVFASALPGGTVAGKVVLRDSQMPAVNKGMDNSGVVVSFVPIGIPVAQTASVVPPASLQVPGKRAVLVQKNKTFLPHVLPVLAGASIDFPNDDPIFHNAFSNYSGQVFDVGLYPPGTKRTVRFTRPGVVRVFCNIHAAMSAVIVVLDTPYFTTSAKDGSWQVDLPPGDYEMRVFHERAKEETLRGLTRRISVPRERGTADPQQVGVIVVSEAGYLPAPHVNKFGKVYPEGSGDDKSYYPGARK